MNDFLPTDVVDAALAEFATVPVVTPSDPDAVEDVLKVTPRHDIFFRDYRDPHSLRLRGVSFPWEMQNAATYDYYRSGTGWMIFLEADLRAVTVRIRHDNPIFEPSPTLMGRTHSVFASTDPEHFVVLMRTITDAIDRGEAPLWAISMTQFLPTQIREALNEPFSNERGNVYLTDFGFHFAGDLQQIFAAMKIEVSSYYGGRP